MENVDNFKIRSIYIDREDAKITEEEERDIFLKNILIDMGVPLENIWPDISLTTTTQKVMLRNLLNKLDLEIIEDGDRGYQIYHKNTILAKWYKPRFILKEDKGARTLSKKLYYEMIIKTWSAFEENDENNTN